MNNLLHLFILTPFIGFLLNALLPIRKEKLLSGIALIITAIQSVFVFVFTFVWLFTGRKDIYSKGYSIDLSKEQSFCFDLSFEPVTAVYLFVGAVLTFLIMAFSRNYLHREQGYKRFFTTVLFFYTGYNIVVLSASFFTLFIGWEVIGLASFLLIAYYRNRYLPVKNAVKIFSIYRLGDIFMLLVIWASHHIWHKNIVFTEYKLTPNLYETIHHYPYLSYLVAIGIVVAASIKSAQIPFSSWLSRAMEGPTPSSAIFYSSLSAHIGVLLLLKTYTFWSALEGIKELVIAIGFLTFISANLALRVQSSIKGQIAYSCISQLGLMFIEVALGWHILALIHFSANAFLRSYQLLISPSIVSYLLREQFYYFNPSPLKEGKGFFNKLKNTLYLLSLEEWHLDFVLHKGMWDVFKSIGKKIDEWFSERLMVALIFLLLLTKVILYHLYHIENTVLFAGLILLLGLLATLKSFVETKSVLKANVLILISNLSIGLMYTFQENFSYVYLFFFILGILMSAGFSFYALNSLLKKENKVNLKGYQGHCYEYPVIEGLYLIGCLGLYGFPISSAFMGIELIYSSVDAGQWFLLVPLSLIMLVNGLSIIRAYARIFLGPHIKTYHESARLSS